MTKFVGDSKKTAAGRSSASMSGKERKKNMERFKSTVDLNRAHVFMDMKYGLKALPRVVVELFDDRCPSATTAFRNRCLEGQHTLKGTRIHKLHPTFAMFGGRTDKQPDQHTIAASTSSKLQHTEAGILSVSRDGQEFTITLGRALQLDADNVVIGRMVNPAAFVDLVNEVDTDPEDGPMRPLVITQCGATDHKGTFETLSQAAAPKTGAEASASMARDLEGARTNLASALQQGLKRKAPATAQQPAVKKGMLALALPDESSDDSDEDAT